jgi:hypothetical protein
MPSTYSDFPVWRQPDHLGHVWLNGKCDKCKRSLLFVSPTDTCDPSTKFRDHDPVFVRLIFEDAALKCALYSCSFCGFEMNRVVNKGNPRWRWPYWVAVTTQAQGITPDGVMHSFLCLTSAQKKRMARKVRAKTA